MFGLSFEKLFVLALIVAVIIGPQRLPGLARRLADAVRSLRTYVETARGKAETEIGVPLNRDEWRSMNLRQYDPRQIVREALAEPAEPQAPSPSSTETAVSTPAPESTPDPVPIPAAAVAPEPSAEVLAQAARVKPGQTHLTVGSAAHPRRIRLADLAPDDPRRLAAEREPAAAWGMCVA